MKPTFSTWQAGGVLPHWAEVSGRAGMRARAGDICIAASLSLPLGAILAVITVLPPVSHRFAAGIGMAGVLAVFVLLIRLRRAVWWARNRSNANFERSGISMWLEDWTAVAQALLALRRQGITDVRAHHAARPDEMRALRRAVLIRDVNVFAVELMGASVRFDADEDLPRVLADPVRMQQVVINLMNNAAEAMVDAPSRRDLTITLAGSPDGVRLDVSDTGAGITDPDLARIFDPFYSTKADGMGMGLAICRNSVEALGGRIWATSTPGRGTTLHVLIPAAGHAG